MSRESKVSYRLVPTSIGIVGIAWTKKGILRLQLPERSPKETKARLLRGLKNAIAQVATTSQSQVILKVQVHLRGDPQDFSDVRLDLRAVSPFYRLVYEVARAIPSGVTKTYGEIAREIGAPRASRAVGQALGRNPVALVIPCHRVTAASGKPGGFSAFGGLSTKDKMLRIEGRSLSTQYPSKMKITSEPTAGPAKQITPPAL